MKPQSWQHVATWYDTLIGEKGGYFHQNVIFPKTAKMLKLKEDQKILDLACGQGAFCRFLHDRQLYRTGVDASSLLIEKAKHYEEDQKTEYLVDDARTLAMLGARQFDAIVSILAIQNIDPIDGMFRRIHELLLADGKFVFVILHPSFRSPRITGWGDDIDRKLQYRRVDRYMTGMKIPIAMHPGQSQSAVTWTYHRPLEDYMTALRQAQFVVDSIEEWISPKVSVGKNADSENLARQEIPVFMAIRALKR